MAKLQLSVKLKNDVPIWDNCVKLLIINKAVFVLFCFEGAGGVRNVHQNKVSSQLSNNSSHHHGRVSDGDFVHMSQRLGNEVMQRLEPV